MCLPIVLIFIPMSTEDELIIRKLPAEQGQELQHKPNFLVTAEAYLSATFSQNISDFFDLCIHWLSVVHVLKERVAEDDTSNPHDFKLWNNPESWLCIEI